MIQQPVTASPNPMTADQFFKRYGIGPDYARLLLAQPHPNDWPIETDREPDDESPFEVVSLCDEPPMPEMGHTEQHEVVAYGENDLVPEEPEAMVIGPHMAEMIFEYSQREPVQCVW